MTANVFAWANALSVGSIDLGLRITLYSLGDWLFSRHRIRYLFPKSERERGFIYNTTRSFYYSRDYPWTAGFLFRRNAGLDDRQPISVGTFADRYALAPMFGEIILLVSLVTWLARGDKASYPFSRPFWFIGGLPNPDGQCISDELGNPKELLLANDLANTIVKTRNIAFAPITPFPLVSDYGVGFAVTLFTIRHPLRRMCHIGFLPPITIFTGYPDFVPGLPVTYTQRNIHFRGSTSQSLIIDNTNASACLEMVDAIKACSLS